jgi:hypothetical protein
MEQRERRMAARRFEDEATQPSPPLCRRILAGTAAVAVRMRATMQRERMAEGTRWTMRTMQPTTLQPVAGRTTNVSTPTERTMQKTKRKR